MELESRTVSSVKATKREAEAARVAALREDVPGGEVQAVAICGVTEPLKPVASAVRLSVQITNAVVVIASAH